MSCNVMTTTHARLMAVTQAPVVSTLPMTPSAPMETYALSETPVPAAHAIPERPLFTAMTTTHAPMIFAALLQVVLSSQMMGAAMTQTPVQRAITAVVVTARPQA